MSKAVGSIAAAASLCLMPTEAAVSSAKRRAVSFRSTEVWRQFTK